MRQPLDLLTLPPTPLPLDIASLSRELFAPEHFVRDNVPEPLTVADLQRSQSHDGDFERLRCFLAKLRQRRNVTIGVVGGSVSAGSSSLVRSDQSGLFHKKMQDWLHRRFPGVHVTHFNAAMPAVPPPTEVVAALAFAAEPSPPCSRAPCTELEDTLARTTRLLALTHTEP